MNKVKLDKDGWPRSLWIPSEDEFCRGAWGTTKRYKNGHGHRPIKTMSDLDACGSYACLVGGVRYSFGCTQPNPMEDHHDPLSLAGEAFLRGVCERLGGHPGDRVGDRLQIYASYVFERGTAYLDRHGTYAPPTFAEVRDAWHAEAEARGYDVGGAK